MLKRLLIVLAFVVPLSAGRAGEPKIVDDVNAAAAWIAHALNSSGYKADFSVESLKEIDRFMDENVREREAIAGGLLSEQLGARMFALGAYVGEVMRRVGGGEWVGDDSDPAAELGVSVRFPDGGEIWPVQKIMKRFKNGTEDSVYVYGKVILEDYLQ